MKIYKNILLVLILCGSVSTNLWSMQRVTTNSLLDAWQKTQVISQPKGISKLKIAGLLALGSTIVYLIKQKRDENHMLSEFNKPTDNQKITTDTLYQLAQGRCLKEANLKTQAVVKYFLYAAGVSYLTYKAYYSNNKHLNQLKNFIYWTLGIQ